MPCRPREVRLLVQGLAFATACAATPALAAERESFTLVYSAPDDASCPDETSFRNLVAARLGYDPFDANRPDLVHVELVRDQGRLRGRAEVTRPGSAPSNARELFGPADKCEALGEALATSLAIALDPMHALTPTPTPPATPPAIAPTAPSEVAVASPPPPPPSPSPPPQAPAAADPRSLFLFGVVGGVVSVGAAPTVTVGGDLALGIRIQSFSLELEVRAETTPVPVLESGNRLEATILSGALLPCVNLGAWSGCVFLRLGALQGDAPDVTGPHLGSSAFVAAGARVSYLIRLSRVLGLRPSLEGALALTRTELAVENQENVSWTAPPAYAGAALALVANFF